MKQDYEVITEGWLDGVYRQKGEILTLHPLQADHLVIARSIRPVKPKAAVPAVAARPAPEKPKA